MEATFLASPGLPIDRQIASWPPILIDGRPAQVPRPHRTSGRFISSDRKEEAARNGGRDTMSREPNRTARFWAFAVIFALAGTLLAPHCRSQADRQPATSDDYRRAEALVRGHHWDEGLEALGPLLAADPGNVKALNLAALALTGKGDIRQADEYFKKALSVDPHFVPALKNLAINEFNTKQLKEAEHDLLLAIQASPDDPVINLYFGELSYEQQKFALAAAALPKAGAFLARDPNVAVHLAVSYLSIGERQKALELLNTLPPSALTPQAQFVLGVKLAGADLFQSAIPYLLAVRQSQPDSYDAAFDLSLCYLNLKQYPEAIELLRALLDRGPETAELNDVLAEAYEGNKETQRAVDSLRKAIALAPDDEDNYLDFAALCLDHQDFPAGLQVLNVGLGIHPNSDRLFFERALLYAMQDKFELAEKDFQQSAILAPNSDSSYRALGRLYLETGNAAQAIETLRKRLREKPGDADLLYLLGEALVRSGAHPGDAAYQEAQSAFERSVKLDPNQCLPRVSLGKMYLEEDRAADAVAQLEQARTINPKEKSTYWQLAVAYRRLGETDPQKAVLSSLKKLNDEERAGSRGKTREAKETSTGIPSHTTN
jgi:tetratricopeptide (TPR) repeat protein